MCFGIFWIHWDILNTLYVHYICLNDISKSMVKWGLTVKSAITKQSPILILIVMSVSLIRPLQFPIICFLGLQWMQLFIQFLWTKVLSQGTQGWGLTECSLVHVLYSEIFWVTILVQCKCFVSWTQIWAQKHDHKKSRRSKQIQIFVVNII